ncbi:MAG: allantoicase [Chitinophagales bacterium]
MDTKKTVNTSIEKPDFTKYMDFALAKMGGKVLYATDDFFAEKENLIKQKEAVFIADKYTDRGKWMDGWESRRKRTSGHDWAIVQLATPIRIRGFNVDTAHFLGNHPPFASIEAIHLAADEVPEDWTKAELDWTEILPKSPLAPGSYNYYTSSNRIKPYTHLKLHIYPDGGVARLRVYGEVRKDWSRHPADELVDLASAIEGGKSIRCNDMFFSHIDNLLMPNRGANMGDGWETKRNRTPNNRDWVIVRLAHAGSIEKINVDTCHFKGNYPDTCSIEACYVENEENIMDDDVEWKTLLPKQKLSADKEHWFEEEVQTNDRITHVRLNIFPDGGVSRLRLFGKIR